MNTKVLYLFYFLSGLTALIYEVVWLRKLELVFGTTTYAVSTVLAVFFTGLGIGAWVFGKFVDRTTDLRFKIYDLRFTIHKSSFINHKSLIINPLILYGFLEVGIGVYAALTPWIFKGIEQTQVYVWQQFSLGYGGFSIVTFLLASLGLILPTILMGGTLPVVVKAVTRMQTNEKRIETNERTGGSVGLLYGLNTLGAVLGVVLAGFWLIASFGMNQTIWVAAFISLVVGGIVIYMNSKFKVQSSKLLASLKLWRSGQSKVKN